MPASRLPPQTPPNYRTSLAAFRLSVLSPLSQPGIIRGPVRADAYLHDIESIARNEQGVCLGGQVSEVISNVINSPSNDTHQDTHTYICDPHPLHSLHSLHSLPAPLPIGPNHPSSRLHPFHSKHQLANENRVIPLSRLLSPPLQNYRLSLPVPRSSTMLLVPQSSIYGDLAGANAFLSGYIESIAQNEQRIRVGGQLCEVLSKIIQVLPQSASVLRVHPYGSTVTGSALVTRSVLYQSSASKLTHVNAQ